MKYLSTMVFVLMFFSIPFCASQTYQSEYLADGWLKVVRTITVSDMAECSGNAITGVCSNTGATIPSSYISGANVGFATSIMLEIANVGPVERQGIELSESLAHVPNGANVVYSPVPSLDGRLAVWQIGSLQSNESVNVSYIYAAMAREGQINRIPPVSVTAEPAKAVLFATENGKVGDRITLKLNSVLGSPMPGVAVRVNYPDGSSQRVATDKSGTASFIAGKEGFYTYTVEGYSVVSLASTDVKSAQVPAIAAAAVTQDKGMASTIFSLLPILGGIFVVAIVVLIVYNFFSVKRDDDASYVPPTKAEHEAAPRADQDTKQPSTLYTQNFTFAEAAKEEQKIDEMTRGLVESRKRQLPQEGAQEGDTGEIVGKGEAEFAESVQDALESDDDMKTDETEEGSIESELAKLEAEASLSGETASDEDDIDKAIAELESIRAQLRERKEKMHGKGDDDAEVDEKEDVLSDADSFGMQDDGVSDAKEEESLEEAKEAEGDSPENEEKTGETALERLVRNTKAKTVKPLGEHGKQAKQVAKKKAKNQKPEPKKPTPVKKKNR